MKCHFVLYLNLPLNNVINLKLEVYDDFLVIYKLFSSRSPHLGSYPTTGQVQMMFNHVVKTVTMFFITLTVLKFNLA